MAQGGDKPGARAPFVRTMIVRFDPVRATWLERLLRRHGHDVQVVSAAAARRLAPGRDLVLVEIDRGQESLELCRELRAEGNAALIAVSGFDTEEERLRVLGAGCDDHVFWDCGAAEVMARIDAVLRWTKPSGGSPAIVHGPLRIDPEAREVWLAGEPVHLTRKEYDLLHLLATCAGAVTERAEVLRAVWGGDPHAAGRTLDTHVSSLRRKLGRWICVTVKGYGLRIGSPEELVTAD
ncbi:response regulator transcription factor [Amycolatopsis carbonis]|uniref:Response regulator transcription factor n=1 Tax=Amycolatopsis carbonis TaxID=715471 RepID=A0A9Y2IAQ4_9PSEU|nr:response regulator transcription factor [Amycolatopsis sp. 2-15]WIX76940.1 response regulator transcription factor [Amycolatopsis sp. 2-15]